MGLRVGTTAGAGPTTPLRCTAGGRTPAGATKLRRSLLVVGLWRSPLTVHLRLSLLQLPPIADLNELERLDRLLDSRLLAAGGSLGERDVGEAKLSSSIPLLGPECDHQ